MTYDLLSRFYDLENADFTEDLDFWVRLAKECGGPVLELGCGTGRVTQQIARAGINVVGLDYSEEMLVLARAKLNRRPELAARATLIYGDMQNFDIDVSRLSFASTADSSRLQTAPTSLHLIIVPFNTFMHLLTTADQLAMLACARKHLGPGGRLVLDMTNPAPAYADSPHETLTLELRIDRVDQIAHIVYHYDATAADGSLKRTLVPLTLRYTFPAEMKLLLERSGFKLVHMYGDYAGSPLDDESERMIVVAEAV